MFNINPIILIENRIPNPTRNTRMMSVNIAPLKEAITSPCLSLATVKLANSLIIVVIIYFFSFIIVIGIYIASIPMINKAIDDPVSLSIDALCDALKQFTDINIANDTIKIFCIKIKNLSNFSISIFLILLIFRSTLCRLDTKQNSFVVY